MNAKNKAERLVFALDFIPFYGFFVRIKSVEWYWYKGYMFITIHKKNIFQRFATVEHFGPYSNQKRARKNFTALYQRRYV